MKHPKLTTAMTVNMWNITDVYTVSGELQDINYKLYLTNVPRPLKVEHLRKWPLARGEIVKCWGLYSRVFSPEACSRVDRHAHKSGRFPVSDVDFLTCNGTVNRKQTWGQWLCILESMFKTWRNLYSLCWVNSVPLYRLSSYTHISVGRQCSGCKSMT